MNTSGIKKVVKTAQRTISKHSPEILTGLGIAGMITAGVMAVKATPKAMDILQKVHEREAEEHLDKKQVAKEIVMKVAPVYIPAVATAALSSGALICATTIGNKRVAALSTAYTLSENALKTYQEKVIETIGEDKEQEVRTKVAEQTVIDHPIRNRELDISNGIKQIYYEPLANTYFTMSTVDYKDCINKLNHRMSTGEMFISVADYCYELGITPPSSGNDIGWNVDHLIEPKPGNAVVITEDGPYQGMTCLVTDFYNPPVIDFANLM